MGHLRAKSGAFPAGEKPKKRLAQCRDPSLESAVGRALREQDVRSNLDAVGLRSLTLPVWLFRVRESP